MDREIVDSFYNTALNYFGNANSLHKLGIETKKLEDSATKQILNILSLDKEVIYTSDIAEANTLAILGYLNNHNLEGKNIVIDDSENFKEIKKYLKDKIEVRDFNYSFIDNKTLMVCTCKYDPKLFNINDNVKYLVNIQENDLFKDLRKIDFIIFDSKLVKGLMPIACLIKDKNIVLEKIIHGGKSTTSYRSGTPILPFIVSFAKALRLLYEKK